MKNKRFFYALFSLIGMIIGVGIFGIPYAVAQAGFLAGVFYLVLLTGVVSLIHLFYGEIALRTNSGHGLVGFAEEYLGKKKKIWASGIIIFQFYGALLAYIIAGGAFLNLIFGHFLAGTDFTWSIIFFIFGCLIVTAGLKIVTLSEFFMTLVILAIAVFFILRGLPLIELKNLPILNISNIFLPYGVILFSLTGGAAIPEVRQILKGQEQKIKKVIILGTAIPALVYLLFTLVVVGKTGLGTTPEAIAGLAPYFGKATIVLGAIFGFLAVITSFIMLGINLKRVFQNDYKLNKTLALGLVFVVPLILFLFNFSDFIKIIGFLGAVAGGLEGILVLLIYWRAKKMGQRQPEFSLKINRLIIYGLGIFFVLGIIYHFVFMGL